MPNIENLKKQAKQYQRWHRERYFPVAAAIRATLPRFRDMGDAEILASNFRLTDALELVARQNGFDQWRELIQGEAPVSVTPEQSKPSPVFTAIEAQLFVADVQNSCNFYTRKLGFTVEFVYGEPPFYGQIRRDQARLNLRLVCEPVFAGDIRKREGLLSASITLASSSEIKQLFWEYRQAEVQFQQSLKKEPWGARTFIISDPDGNLILFAGPSE
jgi:catechol 2,3-dioxygenase-like lactoylglutathione lyase family enzyme